jgi:predicted NAD/FAD-dependent oxidoreductase
MALIILLQNCLILNNLLLELLEQGLIQQWGKHFAGFDGESLLVKDPNIPAVNYYTSVDGMNRIGKYLSRWVDVRNNTLVGGLTHIGSNRTKKRTWMINLTTSEVVGVDAVIIALPAPQAYGILSTTTDEINTLKVVRQIDEVHYNAAYSLMAGYGKTDTARLGWYTLQEQYSRLHIQRSFQAERAGMYLCSSGDPTILPRQIEKLMLIQ